VTRWQRRLALAAGFGAMVFAAVLTAVVRQGATPPTAPGVLSLAVLGDSDSHSYHDRILVPEPKKRGGKFRPTTWQWTEALAQLRGNRIDQGRMGTWGTPIKVAEALDWLRLGGRAPRKQDYQFNFAVSGAKCSDMMSGYYRQAPRLLTLMNRDPARWQDGVVIVRIGVNSIGQEPELDDYAQHGVTPAARERIAQCVGWIRQAVDLIRSHHNRVRFVLVGMDDNSDWPPLVNRWKSRRELANISVALGLFNDGLRQLAAGDPRIAFFDDRAWFRRTWGGRDADGKPAYRAVNLGGAASVTNTQGDEPVNAVVADGHAGTVYNALWAADLVNLLDASFGTDIRPIGTDEIAHFADPTGAFGLRAP
jgi:hypothetical protein